MSPIKITDILFMTCCYPLSLRVLEKTFHPGGMRLQ
jgi:hypothetical protein